MEEVRGRWLFVLPGVPREFQAVLEEVLKMCIRDRLWEIRKAVSAAVATVMVGKINEDVVVPRDRIAELVEDPAALRHIEAMVARMYAAGWVASPVPTAANRRMARMAAGGRILDNRRGMAPPLVIELEAPRGRWLFVLPGVPREFQAVLEEVLIPGFFSGSRALTVLSLIHI